MEKPVILTPDDDSAVLQAIARDLRKQYGDRFRIIRADSGAAALEAVMQLKLRGSSIASYSKPMYRESSRWVMYVIALLSR